MKTARLIQWILLGLASAGCLGLVMLFANLALEDPGDGSTPGSGWSEVLSAVPESGEPAEYQEEIIFDGAPPSPEAKEFFSSSNRFVSHSGLFMLIGLVGFGLVIAAVARRPSGRFAPLAVLGSGGVILTCYWLFGFNTSYPVDFVFGGLLPASLGGPVLAQDPTLDDPYAYGLAFTMWTDFLYQAAFAMSSGVFVTGLLAGRFRTPLVVVAAIGTGSFGFPIACSWIWGAGWLFNLGAYDFAGAGSVHLLAGGVGFALILLARFCPPLAPWQMHSAIPGTAISRDLPKVTMSTAWVTVFILASVGFLLLPLGMQAGSVLALDTPVVASVLHSTLMCLGGSIVTAGVISIPLARRPRGIILFVAALAGLAAICAPGDVLDGRQAAILGLIVGALSTVLLWVFDRFGVDDPLGLVAGHLLGGGTGMLAAGLATEDATLSVQLIAALAFVVLGVTIGACTGLLGWITGLLWTPDKPALPPAHAEGKPQPAA